MIKGEKAGEEYRLENNVRKGENAGYQHFHLFPQCFFFFFLYQSYEN